MAKKFTIIFILIFINGLMFADEDYSFPRNTITFDAGLSYSSVLTTIIIGDGSLFDEYIIMAGAQYEYQILENFSVAGRIDYKLFNISDISLSSILISSYGRYYTSGGPFFLDAILGYGLFTMTDMPVSHYFRYGGRLGWRIDFGKPGGLVLEPFFGYVGALGKTNVDFNTANQTNSQFLNFLNQLLNQMYDYMIRGFFVGGPVIGLGVGYRF